MWPVIVLFGATGYTGQRVAEAMLRRGLRPTLAGRDVGRLTTLVEGLASRGLGKPDAVGADAGDTASVRALIGRGDVLVSTVGPFTRLGEAAVRAAADAGAIYLDSTGEAPFIRRVFEELGPLAETTGATLVPAFGHDFVPGNLAGALALRRSTGKVHRLEVGYLISRGGRAQVVSRGTLVSALGLLTEQSFTWRDGIHTEPTAARTRIIRVGRQQCAVLAIGATEHYALPRLAGPGELSEVDVYVGRSAPVTRAVRLASRLVPVLLGLPGSRSLLRRVGEFAMQWVAEEPDPLALAQVSSHVVSTACDWSGARLAQVHLVSGDPYQLTADLLAWGAQRAAELGVSGPGALGPVEAFGLDVLTTGAAEVGLRITAGME